MAQSKGFLGKIHTEKTRKKIQVTQIVNRLNNVALGKDLTMDGQQLKAAEILLKKALPDLSAVQQDLTNSDGTLKPTVIKLISPNGS